MDQKMELVDYNNRIYWGIVLLGFVFLICVGFDFSYFVIDLVHH